MDAESFAKLRWLQGALEAVSFSEVIRRALQAYEQIEPADLNEECNVIGSSTSTFSNDLRYIHVRIPSRTKERLDRQKADRGGTYSDIINHSLEVLAQLVRNRQAVLEGSQGE